MNHNEQLNKVYRRENLQNCRVSPSVKTRGVGEYASYQNSPSSGASPQSPTSTTTFARTSPPVVPPPSPSPGASPVGPGETLRQPSHFKQQVGPKTWAPVTPLATSPLPYQQQPTLQQQPTWTPQSPQQQPWQVKAHRKLKKEKKTKN